MEHRIRQLKNEIKKGEKEMNEGDDNILEDRIRQLTRLKNETKKHHKVIQRNKKEMQRIIDEIDGTFLEEDKAFIDVWFVLSLSSLLLSSFF